MDYESLLAQKRLSAPPSGIASPPPLSRRLKDHQRLLTTWALRRGKAAVFADTGLGKGWILLEWARVVAAHTGKPALLLAPLSVSQQFAREAEKLGTGITVCSSAADVRPGVNVTNYQKLHKFDVSVFDGVALDESSLLKALDGKTRAALTSALRATPFKLCATATPSPNDHTELGGHAEFLGVMTQAEMLATFFVHDGGSTSEWRLKGHARESFWRWVCSWGAIVKMPSDAGGSDAGYVLPALQYTEHIVPASADDARSSGMLFAKPASNLNEERAARRGTLDSRVKLASDIANANGDQFIVWCGLNDESTALTAGISGSVEVTGAQDDEEKERRIESFIRGDARVLVSKPSICGFGLNLQQVRDVVFCGVSHSFEQFYQAIRRCWRFGQTRPVRVHVVSSELEGRVIENLKAKQRKADELSEETRHHVAAYVRTAVSAATKESVEYRPQSRLILPNWMTEERPR